MDKDVKAVVLRVDSPGGSVLASEEIYREVQGAARGRQAGRGLDERTTRPRAATTSPRPRTRSGRARRPSPARSASSPSSRPSTGRSARSASASTASARRRCRASCGSTARSARTRARCCSRRSSAATTSSWSASSTGRKKTPRAGRRDRAGAGLGGRGCAAPRAGRPAGQFDDAVKAAARRAKLVELRARSSSSPSSPGVRSWRWR